MKPKSSSNAKKPNVSLKDLKSNKNPKAGQLAGVLAGTVTGPAGPIAATRTFDTEMLSLDLKSTAGKTKGR